LSSFEIRPVRTRQERSDFISLPWDIYKNDKFWIPPLQMAVEQSLDVQKNPFYRHARLERWNAYQNNRCVGRIAGIIDEAHNTFHGEHTAFWGFFECIDDEAISTALFRTVEAWAIENAMTQLRGPVSPSTNHECGLQIDSFETKPFIMMTQNPSYYARLVEHAGMSKAKDLYAWLLDNSKPFDDKLVRRAEKLKAKESITIRPIDMKHFDAEIERVLEIYNDAWERNWGFVPMSPDEFRYLAKDMKPILVPELVFLVEVQGEPAAFSLWLPDLNQVMEKIPSGKLLPFGLLKLLWHTKVRRSVNRGRILTLGVRKKFRHLGLASLLYLEYFQKAPKLGYPTAECSWILEDNKAMNRGLELMKANHYKTYRIYEKPLGASSL
jgi:hypothetical protein